MKYAVIDISGVVPLEIVDAPLDLAKMQSLVGGNIEHVVHADKGLDLWFNEEGKLEDLEANERATMICHHGQAIYPSDYIAGNCIVTGLPDDEGNTGPLSREQEDWLVGLDTAYRALTGKS